MLQDESPKDTFPHGDGLRLRPLLVRAEDPRRNALPSLPDLSNALLKRNEPFQKLYGARGIRGKLPSPREIGIRGQRTGEKNALDEDGERLLLQEFLKLPRRLAARVAGQASIQENQRDMKGVPLRRRNLQPPAHLPDVCVFQNLEVRGVAEEEPGFRRMAPYDFHTTPGMERCKLPVVHQESHSGLT